MHTHIHHTYSHTRAHTCIPQHTIQHTHTQSHLLSNLCPPEKGGTGCLRSLCFAFLIFSPEWLWYTSSRNDMDIKWDYICEVSRKNSSIYSKHVGVNFKCVSVFLAPFSITSLNFFHYLLRYLSLLWRYRSLENRNFVTLIFIPSSGLVSDMQALSKSPNKTY